MSALLIDGSSFMYRGYHADTHKTQRSDGLPTGGVTEFVLCINSLLRWKMKKEDITHAAFFMDTPGPTWRHEIFPEYKGNRDEKPFAMKVQMAIMKEIVPLFGLKKIEKERYEADDLIATYSRAFVEHDIDVIIATVDKDIMQLAAPGVRVWNHLAKVPPPENDPYLDRRGMFFNEDDVEAKFGVPPGLLGDYLALVGDASDNIPGAPGVGAKGAANLLAQFGSLEGIIANADVIPGKKAREGILSSIDAIRMGREIIELDAYVPIDEEVPPLERMDVHGLLSFLKALEVLHTTNQIAKENDVDPDDVLIDPDHEAICDEIYARYAEDV